MSKFDSAADIIEAIIALADELGWDVAIKDEDCIDMLILGRKEALTELELHYDIAFDTVTTDGSNDGYEH